MAQQRHPHLTDPTTIDPYNGGGDLQVVIETPKNSRNKYAYDHERGVLALRKVLPAGMVFPYDFGFVPSTKADDGDPLDVLVLMDEPVVPGCVVKARVLGVIEGEDHLDNGETQRNDRLLAVAEASLTYANLKTLQDIPKQMLEHIKEFFANYPKLLAGKTFKVLGAKGPEEANRLIHRARKNA